MQDMIDHHMMAVMMAELCNDRAVHEELLEICEQIEVAQTAEIAEMQSWLHDWYGIDYEPEMSEQMERQLEFLGTLDGVHFEIAFLVMMIQHHSTAVREGLRCEKRAYHEELLAMCEDIVAAQTAEIAQMRQWLDKWYHIGHHRGHRQ